MSDFILRFGVCSTPRDSSTCRFSIVREGLIVSLLSIGTLIGALSGAKCVSCSSIFAYCLLIQVRVADFLGRRRAMTTACLVFIIGVIIQVASDHAWAQFAMGRLISGLGVGALSAAVPMVCVHQGIAIHNALNGHLSIKLKRHLRRFEAH